MDFPSTKLGILVTLAEEKFIEHFPHAYAITHLVAVLFATEVNNFNDSRKVVRVILFKGKGRLNIIKEHTFMQVMHRIEREKLRQFAEEQQLKLKIFLQLSLHSIMP